MTCSRPWVMMMVVMMTMIMTMMMRVSRPCVRAGRREENGWGGRGGNCTAARACAECFNNKVGDEVGARR